MLANRRVDPRTPTVVEWGEEVSEVKPCVEFAELPGRYGIRTTQFFNPAEIDVAIDGEPELEQILSGNPTAEQFYADGESGYIFLHASLLGEDIRVDYYPGGSILTAEALDSDDFKGPKGDTGDTGDTGPAGPAGDITTNVLTGFVAGSNSAIVDTDTVFEALQKTQGQMNAAAGNVATQIHAADAKAVLVDADELGLADSEDSWALKKFTLTNLWTWVLAKVILGPFVNLLIPALHPHGIFNTKFTAVNNSTTEQSFGIDLSVATFNIICGLRKAGTNGDIEWLSSAAAIKITLPTGTWSTPVAGITVTGAYDLYKYIVSDNGTIRTMLSRSPYHKSVPANYYHTISATGMTAVGSPQTAWDAAFLSGSGAINVTNSCVCLGLIGQVTFNGSTGLASAATLATGAVPVWLGRDEFVKPLSTRVAWIYATIAAGVVTVRNSFGVTSLVIDATGYFTLTMSSPRNSIYYTVKIEVCPNYGAVFAAGPQLNTTTPGGIESAPTLTSFKFAVVGTNSAEYNPKYLTISVYENA